MTTLHADAADVTVSAELRVRVFADGRPTQVTVVSTRLGSYDLAGEDTAAAEGSEDRWYAILNPRHAANAADLGAKADAAAHDTLRRITTTTTLTTTSTPKGGN